MGQLDGRTALVTGGTSGIGLAAAGRLAEEGAHVFVTGRRQAHLDEAVASIGERATGIRGDVARSADLDRVFDAVSERGQGLDIVFANAGGGEFAPLGEISQEHFNEAFDRNVGGTVFTVQRSLPLLNPGASIILSGSTTATNAVRTFSVYAATKAAIRAFGRTWAAELGERGIRVNTLTPGPTETPGLVGLAPDAMAAEAMLKGMAASIPLGRLGRPAEIANVVLFLASDQSSFMTGGEIFVDGGEAQV